MLPMRATRGCDFPRVHACCSIYFSSLWHFKLNHSERLGDYWQDETGVHPHDAKNVGGVIAYNSLVT